MGLQEVDSQDGKLDCGPQEGPPEGAAREVEGDRRLTPALDGGASRTGELRTGRGRGGVMRQQTERGAGVHEETPGGELVRDEDQLPGGDGVEPRRAA